MQSKARARAEQDKNKGRARQEQGQSKGSARRCKGRAREEQGQKKVRARAELLEQGKSKHKAWAWQRQSNGRAR